VTLEDIWVLANLWCPKRARWAPVLRSKYFWGSAHEIGHALIEPRSKWKIGSYGHPCSIGFCRCKNEKCNVYEAAAMYISQSLLVAAKRPDIADDEIQATNDYDCITEENWRGGKALLRKLKLWPVPRSKKGLEAALKRRLGSPQGSKRKPQETRVSPLGMFANLLFQGHA
jgi:hypothetical protein